MKELREDLKPYNPNKLKEKEKPEYFKKKRNSQVTYNY